MAAGVLLLGAMATGTARAAGCDRACLQNMMTRYLDAMVAHAPSQLPLAANVRFTEDSRELKLGDGLWKTVTRKGGFRQDYIDVRRQIAAAHVQLFEGGTQVLYSVVLRVAEGKIGGIETLVFRVTPDMLFTRYSANYATPTTSIGAHDNFNFALSVGVEYKFKKKR